MKIRVIEGIEYIYTLEEITKIVDALFGKSNYQYYNIGENGVVLSGVNMPEKRALHENVLNLFLEIRNINLWLSGKTMNYNKPPNLNEIKEKKDEREVKYNNLLELLEIDTENERKAQTTPFPKELETDKAKGYFQRAIKAGFIEKSDTGYIWKGESLQLLAYFTQELSNLLDLGKTRAGEKTVNWKIFEVVFNVSNLKSNKNDWLKIYTTFYPKGYEKIDEILKS